jgi:hypothetical protein
MLAAALIGRSRVSDANQADPPTTASHQDDKVPQAVTRAGTTRACDWTPGTESMGFPFTDVCDGNSDCTAAENPTIPGTRPQAPYRYFGQLSFQK